jgi:predicted ATPase
MLSEAQGAVVNSCERCWEAELYRLKGELLLKQFEAQSPDSQKEAETCFFQALDTASRQSAKCLELRAALSLSHLWRKQGKRAEIRKVLGEVYGRFTEGFGTPDLEEAKMLLAEAP